MLKAVSRCWESPWYSERNASSLLSTHPYHTHRKIGYPCKIPLLEHLKPSWFQMQSTGSGQHAHNSFSTFCLLINPVSLAGHPGLTAWRAVQCALLCMEAGHVQYLCWWDDLGRGDLGLLGSAPWGHSLPNRAQVAQHRLLTLLLCQHREAAYYSESSSVYAVPPHIYFSGCT